MRLLQPAFASGELAPSLGGRVDLARFKIGLKTCRNFIVHRHGGASNRGGTEYLGNTLGDKPARLIPFEFSVEQNYVLEFTDLKMRVLKSGDYVESSPGVILEVTSPYTFEQMLLVRYTQSADVLYMVHPEVAPQALTRSSHTSWAFSAVGTTPTIQPPTAVTAVYTGTRVPDQGATAITQANPVKVTKTAHGFADGARITVGHAPGMSEVSRRIFLVKWVDANNFTLQDETGNDINGLTFGAYAPNAILGITKAAAAKITLTAGHGFVDGDYTWVTGVVGMTEVNDRVFRLKYFSANVFYLQTASGSDVDSSGYTTFSAGGTAGAALMPPQIEVYYVVASVSSTGEESVVSTAVRTTVGAPWGSGALVKLTWTAPTSAPESYNIYKSTTGGFYGFIGSASTTSFQDNNIQENGADGPQVSQTLFNSSGNYPGAVTIFQQRLTFARTDNQPQTVFASQTGLFSNFSVSDPLKDSDSIEATIASRQVNEIRHLVPIRQLLVMTSSTEWLCGAANNNGAISPVSIAFDIQGYRGSSDVAPLVIGNTVLFVQRGGQIIRDLRYQLQDDSYTGDDLSVMAPHLFIGHFIVDWAYQGNPDSIVWCVRDDGALLGLTYLREQEVWAWHRHDTDGFYESVCSLPGGPGDPDEVYFVVRRLINGSWVRFVEQMHDRMRDDDLNQAFFVDAGLMYDAPVVINGFSGSGTNLVSTATAHGLSTGDRARISNMVGVVVTGNLRSFDDDSYPINGTWFEVDVVSPTSFRLLDITGPDAIPPAARAPINAALYVPYVSGGESRRGVTVLSGLSHLANTDVSILADGNVIYDTVSAAGTITLPRRFATISVGLGYVSDLETLELEEQGLLAGKRRQTRNMVLRLLNTRGAWMGSDEEHLLEMKIRNMEGYLEATRMFTGDKEMAVDSKWQRSARAMVRQQDPLPITVLAIVAEVDVEE